MAIAVERPEPTGELTFTLAEQRQNYAGVLLSCAVLTILALVLRASVGLTLLLPLASFLFAFAPREPLAWTRLSVSREGITLARGATAQHIPWRVVSGAVVSAQSLQLTTSSGPLTLPAAVASRVDDVLALAPFTIPRRHETQRSFAAHMLRVVALSTFVTLLLCCLLGVSVLLGRR